MYFFLTIVVPILGFLDLNDAIAPVNTLDVGADVVSEEILIDVGFPTINSPDLHTAVYVSLSCLSVCLSV